MNILKKTVKHKKYTKIAKAGLKKGDKHAAVNRVKEEIEDGRLADRWKRANAARSPAGAAVASTLLSRAATRAGA